MFITKIPLPGFNASIYPTEFGWIGTQRQQHLQKTPGAPRYPEVVNITTLFHLDHNFQLIHSEELQDNPNRVKHTSYTRGVEDCRLISNSELLAVTLDTNTRWKPEVSYVKFDDSKITSIRPLAFTPEGIQKNWLLLSRKNSVLTLLQHSNPFRIIEADLETGQTKTLKEYTIPSLNGKYHNGAVVHLPEQKQYLLTVRVKDGYNYAHSLWILLNESYDVIGYSKPFRFAEKEDSNISYEMCMSLFLKNDTITACLGISDRCSAIYSFSLDTILSSMKYLYSPKIINTYAIVCPQITYKDIFGKISAFSEMNPAIWFEDGKWTVLVRGVNYRKYGNSSFTLYQNPAHSVYWIGEGPDLNTIIYKEFIYDFGSHQMYNSYWNGVEDIRFLDKDILIGCVPQLNPGGQPALFKAKLNREFSVVHGFESLEPHMRSEKNWLPFPGGHVVLYSCSPLCMKALETDSIQEISCSQEVLEHLKGYHGSTNGVKVDDDWIFLVHKNNVNGRTVHRWLHISCDFKRITVSDPFTFFNHSYIEFPCGLVYKENTFYVSLGVNDDKAYILQIAYQ